MKNLANRIKSTISQLTADPKSSDDEISAQNVQREPSETPQNVSVAKPEEKPAAVPIPPAAEKLLQAVPATAKGLAEESARQKGMMAGDEFVAMLEQRQRGIHPFILTATVPGWGDAVQVYVKDAKSWLPVNPPFNRLKARYTGMANVEGVLIFESADICKASRLRRTAR